MERGSLVASPLIAGAMAFPLNPWLILQGPGTRGDPWVPPLRTSVAKHR
jgi:hypothetical protein